MARQRMKLNTKYQANHLKNFCATNFSRLPKPSRPMVRIAMTMIAPIKASKTMIITSLLTCIFERTIQISRSIVVYASPLDKQNGIGYYSFVLINISIKMEDRQCEKSHRRRQIHTL